MSTECTLYEHVNYKGSTRTFNQATSNLVGHGFNDKASSAKVTGRPWIFYQHVDFKGNAQVVKPGDYPTFTSWGGANDDLSSLRPLPSESEGDAVIAIFEHVNYGGRMLVLTSSEANFLSRSFNDIASSLIVVKGTWTVYKHVNYVESIGTYAAGSYVPYLAPNDAMSSAKVVEFPTQCTLYRDVNYSGPSKTFDKATTSLVGIGFNDKASSAKVTGRPWIFYQHVDFMGNSQVLQPGDYPNPDSWGGKNDDLSSLRPLPSANEGEGVIALFEHVNYCGRMLVLTASDANFVKLGFNDVASSLIVIKGRWTVYKNVNYDVALGTYTAGTYVPNLAPNDTLSSAKLE